MGIPHDDGFCFAHGPHVHGGVISACHQHLPTLPTQLEAIHVLAMRGELLCA
eukprot:COSAG01_NODE_25322_length_748_cov_46.374262_1_plen_51_part_10